MIYTSILTIIFDLFYKYLIFSAKKEQKTLLRLKFTAKKPQREHNTRLSKVAVHFSARHLLLYSSAVLRIGICC